MVELPAARLQSHPNSPVPRAPILAPMCLVLIPNSRVLIPNFPGLAPNFLAPSYQAPTSHCRNCPIGCSCRPAGTIPSTRRGTVPTRHPARRGRCPRIVLRTCCQPNHRCLAGLCVRGDIGSSRSVRLPAARLAEYVRTVRRGRRSRGRACTCCDGRSNSAASLPQQCICVDTRAADTPHTAYCFACRRSQCRP